MVSEAEGSGSRLINTWVQIILGIAIFAWGIYAFFYEKQYVPSHMPPSLNVSSKLEKVGETGSLVAIKGTITTKNTSKTRVWVVSSWYNAYGLHVAPDETEKGNFQKYAEQLAGRDGLLARHFNTDAPTIVLASKLTDESTYFEPDEEWTQQFLLYVPHRRYEAVGLDVAFIVAKDMRLLGTKWHAGPTECAPDSQPGELCAETCLKPSESETDLSKCAVLDIEKNPKHKKLQKRYSLLATSSRSLLLLPKPVSAQSGKAK